MRFDGIRFTAVFALASVLGFAQSDTRIVPLYAVAPSVFQTGLTSVAVFTILEANPNSSQRLLDGDKFVFGLNVPGATVISLGPISVNATAFSTGNFGAVLSPDAKQII